MEINDYVRENGIISKTINIEEHIANDDITKYHLYVLENGNKIFGCKNPSKDIIDLIEDEDQIKFRINGDKCYGTVETELCFSKPLKGIWLNKEFIELKDLQIISILTHESFEANAYTIEKER